MTPPASDRNVPPFLPAAERFVRRNALGLKLLFVGFLILLLLVPLVFVHGTLRERRARHDEAVAEITRAWGGPQRLLGPILVVPYTIQQVADEWVAKPDGGRQREQTVREVAAEAFFLPEHLEVNGDIEPSTRTRGIYTTHVYAARLRVAGRFAAPDLGFTGLTAPELQWDRARVCFALSDLRGARETLTLKWAGADVALQAGARLEGFGAGLHAPVRLAPGGSAVEFALQLALNGAESLTLVPVGRQTAMRLVSTWADPGFRGSFLPVKREIGPQGFSAAWQVSHYGRDFPQAWSSHGSVKPPPAATIEAAAFGVNLVETVTAYRTIERAIKYGVLFLALVFVTFFLFEATAGVRLNALNYLLVGAALCLFYLGLLALAEFIGFARAYAGSAGASLLLIACYSWSVLQSGRRALIVGGMLGGVYGYLYFVLQLEDFALLAGTAGLFALLAAVMYATRRVNVADAEPAGGAGS